MEKETFELAEQEDCLHGKLVFNNTPLPAALKKMEDWFGVEMEMRGNNGRAKHVTGVFNNDSVQDLLATLGDSIGFTYRVTRDKVVIKF
jgi:transmembrane sensor